MGKSKHSDCMLSIIICTYNRADILKDCIKSICDNQYNELNYEIVIVDNNSTDNTPNIVKAYTREDKRIRYVLEPVQGLSQARNKGWEEAKGRYLAYIDDDSKVSDHYIKDVMAVIDEYQPDIFGGPIYPYYRTNKPLWFKDEYELRKFSTISAFSHTCRVSGGNFIIKRDLVKILGMFDTRLGMIGNKIRLGEERALLETYRHTTKKELQKVFYSLECYVYHLVPEFKMTIAYMIKRYYNVGKGAARVKKKDPAMAIPLIIEFFPTLFNDFVKTMCVNGLVLADYIKVVLDSFIRLGNITELMSFGVRPVLISWLKKKRTMVRVLLFFERS